ncbi:nuclear transport factor 2 family protein [Actinomadura adrarensis]|uniref:Nuclear transport factor 2 family protein n=1 Tax=Actinomadura adrarensis TaxID=1819600 RepID=A0ABW3CMJ7_9ACTN
MADSRATDTTQAGPAMDEGRLIAMFGAIDAGDWAALATCFHPEIVYERPGYEPLLGRNRVLRFYREERLVKSGAHRLEGVVLQDDRGAVWGALEGVRTDGRPISLGFADIYHFEAGTIRKRRSHFHVPAV